MEFTDTFDNPEQRLIIVEKHEPAYHVETKVAAPVYILPKHGPVYSQRSQPVPGRLDLSK